MRGDDRQQPDLFLYGTLERRIPEKHPLRPVRAMTDAALEALSSRFDEMYSKNGRPSIAPEKLLLALLLLSDEHFTVDGTLIEAWASQKSFRPKGGSDDSGEGGFRGQKRRNDTHRSTTDPEATLYRKSNGQEAKLSYTDLLHAFARFVGAFSQLQFRQVGYSFCSLFPRNPPNLAGRGCLRVDAVRHSTCPSLYSIFLSQLRQTSDQEHQQR